MKNLWIGLFVATALLICTGCPSNSPAPPAPSAPSASPASPASASSTTPNSTPVETPVQETDTETSADTEKTDAETSPDAEKTADAEKTTDSEKTAEAEKTEEEKEFEKYENDPEAWMKKMQESDDFMAKALELGKLLVDDEKTLTRLDPERPIWVDKPNKKVVVQGWVCQNKAMLEFLICFGKGYLRTFPYRNESGMPEKLLQFNGPKAHESILSVEVPPSMIHAGLLAIGANTGTPVKFQPEFTPPTGDEIRILLRWLDAEGKIVEVPAQDVVLNMENNQPMSAKWVFAGSVFDNDDDGVQRYAADSEGEIVGVSNFPSVMIDIGQQSSDANEQLSYQANEKALPPRGTPVTIIFSKE